MRRQRIEDLLELAVPEQPALAPDARNCAYVLRTADAEADQAVRSLWCVSVGDDRGPRRLTRGRSDTSPAWSPDGSAIAFLRAEDGPAQVWLLPADGGEPEQLTKLRLGAGAPVWSPDGSQIAFAAATDSAASSAESEDEGAAAAKATEPIVVDRLSYQADGAGFLRSLRKHLHVLDVETKDCRQLTRGDWHAGDPAWSPTARRSRSPRRRRQTRISRSGRRSIWSTSLRRIPRCGRSASKTASPGPSRGLLTGRRLSWSAGSESRSVSRLLRLVSTTARSRTSSDRSIATSCRAGRRTPAARPAFAGDDRPCSSASVTAAARISTRFRSAGAIRRRSSRVRAGT